MVRLVAIIVVWAAFLAIACFILFTRYDEAAKAILFTQAPPFRLILFVGGILNILITLLLLPRSSRFLAVRVPMLLVAVIFWIASFGLLAYFLVEIMSVVVRRK